jgi:hypothetical protein
MAAEPREGVGVRRALFAAAVTVLAGAAAWRGYRYPALITWAPVRPDELGLVGALAVGAYSAVSRFGRARGVLRHGPVVTPQGLRPGIRARIRVSAVALRLVVLLAVPAATALLVGVNLAGRDWEGAAIIGAIGLAVSARAVRAAWQLVRQGLSVGLTATGVWLAGGFAPWDAIDWATVRGRGPFGFRREVRVALDRPRAVWPRGKEPSHEITMPAALVNVPAESLVAAIEFYRRHPHERARLAYPYPDGAPAILPDRP